MSQITRTGHIQMVDVECAREVLEQLGASSIQISHTSITCQYNGDSIHLTRTVNGVIGFTMNDYDNRVGSHLSIFDQMQEKYPALIHQKMEKIRLEKERIERIRLEKIRVEKEIQAQKQRNLDELNSEARTFQLEEQEKSALRLQELEHDMAKHKAELELSQEELNRIDQSKKNFVETTQKEFIKRGEKGGWTLSENYVESQRNVTRIQFRKQMN